MEDQARPRRQGPRALRRYLRRVSPRTGQRSRVRHPIPGQEFLVFDKRWKQDPKGGWVLDEVQKQVAHMGTDPAQANVLQTRQVQIPGLPRPAAGARSRRALEVQESADLLLDQHAVLDRADDRRRQGQPEMAEGQRHQGAGDQRVLGRAQQLSQSGGVAGETALSRAAAERRLGDRSLSAQRFGALAVLDAEARGRASEAVLPRRAGFRSAGMSASGSPPAATAPARPAKPCSGRRKATAGRSTATA